MAQDENNILCHKITERYLVGFTIGNMSSNLIGSEPAMI